MPNLIDADELDLFAMNDFPTYEEGMKQARDWESLPASAAPWRNLVAVAMGRYRREVEACTRLEAGETSKAREALRAAFIERFHDVASHKA